MAQLAFTTRGGPATAVVLSVSLVLASSTLSQEFNQPESVVYDLSHNRYLVG